MVNTFNHKEQELLQLYLQTDW